MRNRKSLEMEVARIERAKKDAPSNEMQGKLSQAEWALLLNVPKKEVSKILGY